MRTITNFGVATGAFIAERDDWLTAIERAIGEGWEVIELTAITEERFDELLAFSARSSNALSGFRRVSVHAPIHFHSEPAAVVQKLASWHAQLDLVLHPDLFRGQPALRALGKRVVFENMDVAKDFGRTVEDMRDVFAEYPDAGFCLDVAHVWTNDPSLALAHEFLDSFGDRLRQLHVSGIEPDGVHRPTTPHDLDLYRPVLDRCPHVPWLLETELAAPEEP
jgi:sugar phosphate isomerase/epimerase